MSNNTIQNFRLLETDSKGKALSAAQKQVRGCFLKGPVPCDWFKTAWPLPKRALQVGFFIWHISGIEKRFENLTIRPKRVKTTLGVSVKSVYRALRDLEGAGLIVCNRKRGKCARVAIVCPEQVSAKGTKGTGTLP